ncbi:DUF1836 domain-containing protein [Heyndrickxia sporothermodurans]|uniref:DUF1836 domain-containing protein n=1 Tax=Heyndrickxia sporothermodurans TaxID=46224 RepID=UPI002E21F189|nr:DUF1836 domain-containing protein [Heyndrickxia sporothermodurans]
MLTFQLTRKEMADILLALKGWDNKKPLTILRDAWIRSNNISIESEKPMTAFITTILAPILDKVIKFEKTEPAFSINEIVALGNQIENTNFTTTAVQNWVKRDLKEMISSPQKGKKYSLEQTALLFLVEDLKTALDFDSIRKLLKLVVNDPENDNDDLINPVHLYACYSTLFDHINHGTYEMANYTIKDIENIIESSAKHMVDEYTQLSEHRKEAIRNTIVIATLSVFTAYFQMYARKYLSATLFLQDFTAP